MFVSPHALTSRAVWHVTEKGWSSDFPPLPSAFSPKRAMALLSGSHNGVHCCGTVGDSHSSSQLIAAKRTFTGEGRGLPQPFTLILSRITMQGRCKPSAIELARIAEVQPVLAISLQRYKVFLNNHQKSIYFL